MAASDFTTLSSSTSMMTLYSVHVDTFVAAQVDHLHNSATAAATANFVIAAQARGLGAAERGRPDLPLTQLLEKAADLAVCGAALERLDPCFATAASMDSRSGHHAGEACHSAPPCRATAASTTLRFPRSAAEVLQPAQPCWSRAP